MNSPNNIELNCVTTQTDFYAKYIATNLPKSRKEWIWFWLIILVVICIGSVICNQLVGYLYKVQLLQSACQICEGYGNSCYPVEKVDLSNLTNLLRS